MTRVPPQPEEVMWQNMVEPSPHNGGWSFIMFCRRVLHYPIDMLPGFTLEHAYDRIADGIERHGEPPIAFKRAWLLDAGTLHYWVSQDPNFPRSLAVLEATRALWRETFGTAAPLALPSPIDTPAGTSRRRADRRAIARRHLQHTETQHA